jgi:hypothetical protein
MNFDNCSELIEDMSDWMCLGEGSLVSYLPHEWHLFSISGTSFLIVGARLTFRKRTRGKMSDLISPGLHQGCTLQNAGRVLDCPHCR